MFACWSTHLITHDILATCARYARGRHISVSRQGLDKEPIDEALKLFGVEREIVVSIVGGFSTALALARASDLIASVPERHTGNLRAGMFSFPLPFSTPEFTVSMLWHPRLWMPISRIAGCASVFGTHVRSNSSMYRHTYNLPKIGVLLGK